MDRETATLLVDQFYRECDDTPDLNDNQVLVLVGRLMKLSSANVNDVARIATQEFPREKPMAFRPGFKMPQQQQAAQSREQMNEVIADFINTKWPLVAPQAIPPFGADGQVASVINYNAFAAAVKQHTVYGTGPNPVRPDILSDIVISLDQAKPTMLEHYPATVTRERVVEKVVEKPLTRRQEQRYDFELDRKMNSSDSPIKGASEQAAKKPVVPQAQLEAQARHDLRENEVMGDVRSIIAGHTHSGSHAATRYEREILTNVMNTGVRQSLSAENILANVKAKQDVMAKWGPQQALKELRPELFTSQPQAGY